MITLWSSLTGLTGNSGKISRIIQQLLILVHKLVKILFMLGLGQQLKVLVVLQENDARWRIFWGSDVQITGGTYYSGITTLDLYNNTGGTVTITGFTGTITGGTYDSGLGILTLNNSDGNDVTITGFTSGGGGSPLKCW
jgi:hypothetical protein